MAVAATLKPPALRKGTNATTLPAVLSVPRIGATEDPSLFTSMMSTPRQDPFPCGNELKRKFEVETRKID
jgi:hypothetical protein